MSFLKKFLCRISPWSSKASHHNCKDRAAPTDNQLPIPNNINTNQSKDLNNLKIEEIQTKGDGSTKNSTKPRNKQNSIYMYSTQLPGPRRRGYIDLVIGLDFGTSCTKVVIHAPNITDSPAYAVPFGDIFHGPHKYFQPSLLWISQNGKASLTGSNGGKENTNLKVNLFEVDEKQRGQTHKSDQAVKNRADILVSCYLALVLQHARYWFFKNKGSIFKGFDLRWSLNLGVPTVSQDSLYNLFISMGKAAWAASICEDPINTSAMEDFLTDAAGVYRDNVPELDEFHVVPEVTAEVVSYSISQQRNPGLHVMIDIGAETLDICGFILHEDDEGDVYALLNGDVSRFGAARLHQARLGALPAILKEHIDQICNLYDPTSCIPDDYSSYIPNAKTIDETMVESAIAKAEIDFSKKSDFALRKIIWGLKKRRDPKSDCWKQGLPIFLCGGGSNLSFYADMPERVIKRLQESSNMAGCRMVVLPKPDNLIAELDSNEYHRLAVAWGLSQQFDNIGKTIPPENLEDMPEDEVRDTSARFISKEQV